MGTDQQRQTIMHKLDKQQGLTVQYRGKYSISYNKKIYEKECMRSFLVLQWLRLCASNAGGTDLIPGQGTRLPHTMCHGLQRKKKERDRENACICVTESTGLHSSQHCKLTIHQ